MRSTSDDPVYGVVLSGTSEVFVLSCPVVIHEEVLVNDGINIGVSWWFDGESGEVRFVLLGVNGEGAEELLRLIEGFIDGKGPFDPVDHGVDFFQPRES